MSLEAFEILAERRITAAREQCLAEGREWDDSQPGLIPMKIVKPFAPYMAGAIAGFNAERAALIYQYEAGYPIDENGRQIRLMEVFQEPTRQPEFTRLKGVDIPHNWQELGRLEKIKLAKEISGDDNITGPKADFIISEEWQRRSQSQ